MNSAQSQEQSLSTQMHRCLEVPELLTIIFRYLTNRRIPEHNPIQGSSTLSSLARTCKALSGPALDILWEFLPDLKPLILCLPPDSLSHNANEIKLTRDLVAADFERVRHYASRVRILGAVHKVIHSKNDLSPIVLSLILARRRDAAPLLPRLHSAIMHLGDFSDQALYSRLITGPALKSVQLVCNRKVPADHAWDNVGAVLSPYASALSRLIIRPYPFEPQRRADLMNLYCRFEQITVLSSPSICVDNYTFSHLGSLPNLQKLEITFGGDELTKHLATKRQECQFSALIEFIIATDDLSKCTLLLIQQQFRRLEALTISRNPWGVIFWDINDALETLGPQPLSQTLKAFTITTRIKYERFQRSVSSITATTIKLLMAFKSLTHIEFRVDARITINDMILEEIGTMWPRLKVLVLYEWSIGMVPDATFVGLLRLLAACPELTKLTLRVNALEIPPFSQTGNITPARRMERLNICTSPMENYEQMAALFTVVFPNLATVEYGWAYFVRPDRNDIISVELEERYYQNWENLLRTLLPLLKHSIPRVPDMHGEY